MKKGFDLVDPEIASRQHQLQPSTNSTPTNLSPRHRNIGQSYDSDDLESSNSSSSSSNSIMSSEKASLLPLQVDSEAPKVTYSHFCVAVGSCLLYSLCSISMVILNKYISSGLSPEAREKLPDLLVIFLQCLVAVVSVEAAKLFGIVQYPSFEWKVAKAWLPLNLLFIGMLFSGFMSLVYVSVPMVTIFKNLTNLVTVTGDWYLFGEK